MVTSDSNATSSARGLSKGAIAGLIIGLLSLILGEAIVVIVVALVLMKHKQSKGKYSTRKQHAFGMTKYVCNLIMISAWIYEGRQNYSTMSCLQRESVP